MTEVCHAVMREGITCYIEHTGGGILTLYAGFQIGDSWTIAAGPGRYAGINGPERDLILALAQAGSFKEAVANTERFAVGPGSMAEWAAMPQLELESRVWTCPELATVAEIADEIIHQVREHVAQTPVVTPVKTWPETAAERDAFVDWQYEVEQGDTLRGFRDWLQEALAVIPDLERQDNDQS
jgi:hypothetical protein